LWQSIVDLHEAESREQTLNFTTHIAFEETILGSRETFIASCVALTRWCEAELVSFETVVGSHGVYLASCEVVIGSQRTSVLNRDLLPKGSQRCCDDTDLPVLVQCRRLVLSLERSY